MCLPFAVDTSLLCNRVGSMYVCMSTVCVRKIQQSQPGIFLLAKHIQPRIVTFPIAHGSRGYQPSLWGVSYALARVPPGSFTAFAASRLFAARTKAAVHFPETYVVSRAHTQLREMHHFTEQPFIIEYNAASFKRCIDWQSAPVHLNRSAMQDPTRCTTGTSHKNHALVCSK